jgi:hypothetical protein
MVSDWLVPLGYLGAGIGLSVKMARWDKDHGNTPDTAVGALGIYGLILVAWPLLVAGCCFVWCLDTLASLRLWPIERWYQRWRSR